MKPSIRKLVLGVHMDLGHDGLRSLLKKGGLNVDNLTGTDLVMAINNHGDKMKVIGSKGLVIGYLKMPKGRKIEKQALRYIPQTFGSTGFSYDEALAKMLYDKLPEARPRGPLLAARKMRDAGL